MSPRILVVRLGAMGDIIHALPAVASLKHGFPGARVTWVVEPRWAPLLDANPFVDRVTPLRRGTARGILASWREIRSEGYDFAVDFQGLIKSAVTAACARPTRIFGFHRSEARERAAALFYSDEVSSASVHVVDRNLDLAAAAGATAALRVFPLPPGAPEGELPHGDFVLASPLAGWRRKQWPLAYYGALAARLRGELGMALVLDGPASAAGELGEVAGAERHFSGLRGLIYATRRAAAVVGVDSGPMHLAAALGRPGVAIFGPTDPARNGPYNSRMRVLRSASAATTYKRSEEIDSSMHEISPDEVFESLRAALGGAAEGRP
jgi:heptosyltransferase-1